MRCAIATPRAASRRLIAAGSTHRALISVFVRAGFARPRRLPGAGRYALCAADGLESARGERITPLAGGRGMAAIHAPADELVQIASGL